MQHSFQSGEAIPSEAIRQMAETHHMGELSTLYSREYESGLTLPSIVVGGIWVAGLTTIAGTVVVAFFFPLLQSSVFFLALSFYYLILFLLGALLNWHARRTEVAHRQDQIAFYTAGFLVLDGRTLPPFLWENIESLQRRTFSNDRITDMNLMRVKVAHRTFDLFRDMNARARAEICDRIEHGFVSSRFPQIMAQYNDGLEIPFSFLFTNSWRMKPRFSFSYWSSTLRVSQAGIRIEGGCVSEFLTWPMVEKAEVGLEWVTIKGEGESEARYRAGIRSASNVALLKALLEYRQFTPVLQSAQE